MVLSDFVGSDGVNEFEKRRTGFGIYRIFWDFLGFPGFLFFLGGGIFWNF